MLVSSLVELTWAQTAGHATRTKDPLVTVSMPSFCLLAFHWLWWKTETSISVLSVSNQALDSLENVFIQ